MKTSILLFLFLLSQLSLSAQLLKKLSDKAGAAAEKAMDRGLSGNADKGSKSEQAPAKKSPNAGPAAAAAKASAVPSSKSDGTWSPSDYGQTAFELLPGEIIAKGEFSLKVTNTGRKINLITIQDGQYFFYENGKRSGPYASPPYQKLGAMGYNTYGDRSTKQSNPSKYLEGTGAEKSLLIKGKKYGSFTNIIAFYLSEDQEKFYAICEKKSGAQQDFFILSHKGSTKLPGYAPTLLVSKNYEYAAAIATKTQLNAKTEQERYQYSETDETFAFLSDGQKIGPLADWKAGKNLLGDNGKILQLKDGNNKQVFINGQQGPVFAKSINHFQSLFLNKKGSAGAYYDYGSLYFSDGTRLAYSVLTPVVDTEDGKDYLFWLSVKENKLYVCRKEI